MAGDNGVLILKDVFFFSGFCVSQVSHKPKRFSSSDLNSASAGLLVFSVHPRVHLCVFCPLSGLSQRRVGSAHL